MSVLRKSPVMLLMAGSGLATGDVVWTDLGIPDPMTFVLWGAAILSLVVIGSLYYDKSMGKSAKKAAFVVIIISVLVPTFYLDFSTLYLNQKSSTGGPVHWHADFEIWSCGVKYDLINPKGLENRVGTALFHEHNDDRMHVEGPVLKYEHVSLGEFFRVTGGSLSANSLSVPTNTGMKTWTNGDPCSNGAGGLQIFVYKTSNPADTKRWKFSQEKIENWESYVMSPQTNVPPGDCIIFEFGPPKASTEHICSSYKVGIEKGELTGV